MNKSKIKELKEFIFSEDESNIAKWFIEAEDLNKENFSQFRAFFMAYYNVTLNDMYDMDYLPITKREMSLILTLIDINNKTNEYINLSTLITKPYKLNNLMGIINNNKYYNKIKNLIDENVFTEIFIEKLKNENNNEMINCIIDEINFYINNQNNKEKLENIFSNDDLVFLKDYIIDVKLGKKQILEDKTFQGLLYKIIRHLKKDLISNNPSRTKYFLRELVDSGMKKISHMSSSKKIIKVDKMIKRCSHDKLEGFVPHISLYENDLDNFFVSFDDFIRFVEEDVISFEKIKEALGYNYRRDDEKGKKIDKDTIVQFLKDLKRMKKTHLHHEEWYDNYIVSFIKLFREANLLKKVYHTIRVLYTCNMCNENIEIPDFIKELILTASLQHDIGRIYQGAYHDEYVESLLTNDEKIYGNDYGTVNLIDSYNHPLIGYMLGINTATASNKEKRSEIRENFERIMPIISYSINVHQTSNDKAQYLDNINIELLNSKNQVEIISIIENVILKVYEYSKKLNLELPKHKFSYATQEKKGFYSKLQTMKNFKFISELLKTYSGEYSILKKVAKEAEANDLENYDFATMLGILLNPNVESNIKYIKTKKKFTEEELKLLKLNEEEVKKLSPIEQKKRNTLMEVVKEDNLTKARIIRNLQREFNEIENIDYFKSLINLISLCVMDMDKFDILVQCSNVWLDNENYRHNIKLQIEINEGEFDLGSYLNINHLDNNEKIKIINTISEMNNNIGLELKEGKIILIIKNNNNNKYFPLTVPMELLNSSLCETKETELTPKSKTLQKIGFQKEILKEYLCIDEHNEDFESFAKHKQAMRAGNSLQIVWWRIHEFIMRNTRLKSSLITIKDTNLLNRIYNHFKDLDPDFAVLLKPIIYVAKKYIEKGIAVDDFVINKQISKSIRKEIQEEIKELYESKYDVILEDIKDCNLDKMFELLIIEGDKKIIEDDELNNLHSKQI